MFLNLMQILKTKTVKRRIIMSEKDIHGNNYNAHPETARNKWFNYSDAYIDKDGENQPVADYQKQFAQSVNNARDVSDSKDGMRHENNKGTFQALPETEQYGDTVTPVFLNKEVLASSKLSQDLDEAYETPSEKAPDNGSVKEFYNSKRIPSTDSFNEVENDGRYE